MTNRLNVYEFLLWAGSYHCPVTFRIFNENTHIVAVGTTGNVFCNEVWRYNNGRQLWTFLKVSHYRVDIGGMSWIATVGPA